MFHFPEIHLAVAYHLAELLAIIYLIVSQHQTKNMLLHLARTITSVNDHLDTLVSLTRFEADHEKRAAESDFNHIHEDK